MAAGSFLFENKLRPGCYIQIKGVPKASANMSERGTAVILMNADSGGLLTEISANDILTGGSAAKGFPLSMFTDTKSILNYVYPYVNKLFIGRLNSGGTKAQAVVLGGGGEPTKAHGQFTDLTIEAANSGAEGNNLRVSIYSPKSGVDDHYVQGIVVNIYDNNTLVWYGDIGGLSSEDDVYKISSDDLNDMSGGEDASVSVSNYVEFLGDIEVPEQNGSSNAINIPLSGGSDGGGGHLLTAKANYDGTFGNGLSVMIVAEASGEGKYKGQGFFVRTSLNGEVVDEQNVKLPSELSDNDYLQFIKADGLSALSAVAAVDLTGGSNGSESDSNLSKILGKLTGLSWNTLGFCGKDDNKSVIDTYIKNLRENKGKYRQAVLFNSNSSDYEGVVSPFQAFAVDDDDVDWLDTESSDPTEEVERLGALRLRQMFAVGFVTAITAGSDVNISNTYAPVPANVIEVIPAQDEDEDVEGDLRAGLLTFTHNSRNQIVIEKDINTLHTYTQTRTVPFSKNRVIRCLDELSNTKVMVWEEMFIGKIDNNVTGRNLLKSQILAIIQNLVKLGALNESDTQIIVEPGDDPDKVRSYETVRPIDAMEQLYSYVTVLG